MSRSTKQKVGSALGVLALGLVLAGSTWLVQRILSGDPLAEFRPRAIGASGEEPATVVIENTTLEAFDGARPVIQAQAARLEITRDRQIYRAIQLRNGKVFDGDKLAFEFEAGRGVWNDVSKFLSLQEAIRIRNADMDLSLSRLEFDQKANQLRSLDPLRGQLFRGKVAARTLQLDLRTRQWQIEGISWQGRPPQQTEGVPIPAKEEWIFEAQSASGESDRSMTYLQAKATSTDVHIRADKIERFLETGTNREVLVATGNVRYFSPDANLICDKVTVFRRERRAILEGRVTMLIKPEQEAGLRVEPLEPMRPLVPEEIASARPGPPPTNPSDDELRRTDNRRKYPVRVLAERIEYFYAEGQRRALISGSPQARQELPGGRWRMIWAPRAEWDGENEILRLLGDRSKQQVRMMQSNGDRARADVFGISTARDVERWTGENLQFQGAVDDEDLPTPPSNSGSGGSGSGQNNGQGNGGGGTPPPPISGTIG